MTPTHKRRIVLRRVIYIDNTATSTLSHYTKLIFRQVLVLNNYLYLLKSLSRDMNYINDVLQWHRYTRITLYVWNGEPIKDPT